MSAEHRKARLIAEDDGNWMNEVPKVNPPPVENIGYQHGVVVRLNSGSPPMTVHKLLDNGSLDCRWFVDGKVEQCVFPIEELYIDGSHPHNRFLSDCRRQGIKPTV